MANEAEKERKKILGEITRLTKQINDYNSQGIQDEQRLEELNNRRLSLAKKLRAANQKIRSEQKSSYVEAEDSIKSLSAIYEPLIQLERQRIQIQMDGNDISSLAVKRGNKLAKLNQKISELTGDQTIQREVLQEQFDEELKKFSRQKGVSGEIIDNLREQNQLARDYSTLTEEQKGFLEQQVKAFTELKKKIGGVLEVAEMLTDNMGVAFGVGIIAAGKALETVGKEARDLGMFLNGITIEATTLNILFDDGAQAVKSLASELGTTGQVLDGVQLKAIILSRNLGLSVESTAQLTGAFARLNGNSTDIANNLLVTTREFAKQNNVIPSQVLSDLAQNTEAFAVFAKDGGKNLIEAGVAAAKLGLNLQSLTNVADSLLDFEQSINSELELGALLGRQINLDRARTLAFEGQIGDAVKETVNQLGGAAEFDQMSPIQKREAARALGIQVVELEKMVQNMDKLNSDGTVQVSQFSMMQESIKGIVTGHGAFLKQIGSAIVGTAAIGGNLAEMSKVSPVIAKTLGKIPGFGMAGTVPSGRTPTPTTTPNFTKGPGDAIGGKGSVTQSLGKINMNAVLKGAAALVIVAGAVFVFGKAVQEFMEVNWNAVGMAVVSMFALVGSIAALGAVMSSGVGTIAILAGASAMLVVASSIFILGKALQEIGKGFEMIGSVGQMVNTLVEQTAPIMLLSTSLFALAGALTAVGTAGIVSIPGLVALGAIGSAVTGINRLLGIESETTTSIVNEDVSQYQTEMLSKMERLIETTKQYKDVYIDGTKVTGIVTRSQEGRFENRAGVQFTS